jgi:hypothetical protein
VVARYLRGEKSLKADRGRVNGVTLMGVRGDPGIAAAQ